MKKLLLAVISIMVASPAFAEQAKEGRYMGGFTGPSANETITVEEAKKLSDDADVVLVGNIISHVKGENYMFKDETGTIVVEIDKKDWRGQDVAPGDKVQIIGEVDKSLLKDPKIDVDQITKLAK
ncbi:MAG: NirD/YgiW/YdeI family stress tolerance protein [Lactobacillaceae bacterium]|jgi:uncharacterized protein (TIGR00156 family)|nr:NirD/YgiW/YdeI family stress tolerance protein [Lactobacillaceae bacterium]